MIEFKEVARLNITPARDIVMSKVVEDGTSKGVNVTSYVRTDKYTGFSKGVFVPEEKLREFNDMVGTVLGKKP